MRKRDPSAVAYAANINRAMADRLMDEISLQHQEEISVIFAKNTAEPKEVAQIENTKNEFFECKRQAICLVLGWAQRSGREPSLKNYPSRLDKEIERLAVCYARILQLPEEEAKTLAQDAKESILIGVADSIRQFGDEDRRLHNKPTQQTR